jgi:hypothetical protein
MRLSVAYPSLMVSTREPSRSGSAALTETAYRAGASAGSGRRGGPGMRLCLAVEFRRGALAAQECGGAGSEVCAARGCACGLGVPRGAVRRARGGAVVAAEGHGHPRAAPRAATCGRAPRSRRQRGGGACGPEIGRRVRGALDLGCRLTGRRKHASSCVHSTRASALGNRRPGRRRRAARGPRRPCG